MTANQLTIAISLVMMVITAIGAGAGVRSREVAKTAILRADEAVKRNGELEDALEFERGERAREQEQCDRKVRELRTRIDDLTDGWLDRLAPQAAAAMAPHVARELAPHLERVVREAQR